MPKSVNANGLRTAINDLLKEYGEEVQKDIDEVIPKVAKEAQRKLKSAGKPSWKVYNAGWKTYVENKRFGVAATVYNSNRYQLIHLLEYSHPMPQGGTSTAYPHVAPVNDWVHEEVVKQIQEKMKG